MYCLRLFIFTRTTLFTTMYYCGVFIETYMYVYAKFRLDWLLREGHLCPYRNVMPEAVYTRTTLFTIFNIF